MKQRVVILGSTGSIGRGTLDVVHGLSEMWEVAGLAAGSNVARLAEQANRFRPEAVAIASEDTDHSLKAALEYSPRVFSGPMALENLVSEVYADCVICAVVGADGLGATVRAIELGRRIGLANKEALVIAGSVLMPLAEASGATIIPIDSEHSAVFQAMRAGRQCDVRKIYLTSSGGPFRTWSEAAMADITVEDALCHPTWTMGPKITIDSATMMNKALEIVEARWLFNLRPDQIEVVIHPESIIHSFVEFCDGSLIAQLGTPDMRTPIQYALTFPKRYPCPSEPLDLFELGRLNFHPPTPKRFPALALGHEVATCGGTAGAVLNAANEVAVQLFRDKEIGYTDIARLAGRALSQHVLVTSPTLEDLLKADTWAREEVARCTIC